MSIQLTPEQEQRIRTVVNAGAYRSAEEAAPEFEGGHDELEKLLLDGLNSGEPVEADGTFWSRLRAETDSMAAEHQARKPRP
jgi:predicted kinase